MNLLRLAKAISKNPWIAVPILGLIGMGFVLEQAVMSAYRNPLPDEDKVRNVEIVRAAASPEGRPSYVQIQEYFQLRRCLGASGSIDGPTSGQALATMTIRKTDDSSLEVTFYEGGVVDVGGDLCKVCDEAKLAALVNEIAPPPRRSRASRRPRR